MTNNKTSIAESQWKELEQIIETFRAHKFTVLALSCEQGNSCELRIGFEFQELKDIYFIDFGRDYRTDLSFLFDKIKSFNENADGVNKC